VLTGIRVPDDIALIGYDDISFASLATAPLSSIRQPAHEMGRRAMELLGALMDGSSPPRSTQQVVFIPELEARASTMRAGRGR
jgi:LacI family transcriptional regulator